MTGLINRFICIFSCIPNWIYTTLARIFVGLSFYRSGLTKFDDYFEIRSVTYTLFNNEYFPNAPFPESVINVMAFCAAYAEVILPVLLFIGLGSRFAALGLLVMTIVIQFVYPSAYMLHLSWGIALLTIIVNGAGPLSLDYFIKKSRG
ncbi:MAG: DoxX family protein [Rhodomicrobiaceae bacterium]|jgi:putative oxidoreductase